MSMNTSTRRNLPKAEAYMKQIAEARRARLKLFSPHASHDEWVLLSRRKNMMIDAEDAKTSLFQSDRMAPDAADDLAFVEEMNKSAIPTSVSAEDVRLSPSQLTVKDTIVRLVRTLNQQQMATQELARSLDLNGDGALSVAGLHAGVLEHLGVFLSEAEMAALVLEFDNKGSGSLSAKEFVRALDTESFKLQIAVGSRLTDSLGNVIVVTRIEAERDGLMAQSGQEQPSFHRWAELFGRFHLSRKASLKGIAVTEPYQAYSQESPLRIRRHSIAEMPEGTKQPRPELGPPTPTCTQMWSEAAAV